MTGLYSTVRWAHPRKGRRKLQLDAEPLCRMCLARGITTEATVADHIIPHDNDPHLFWHGELQSLCASCHSGPKQAEEKTGVQRGCDANGRPTDPLHPWNRT